MVLVKPHLTSVIILCTTKHILNSIPLIINQKNWLIIVEKTKLNLYIKVSSRWTKHLNVKSKTKQVLEYGWVKVIRIEIKKK